MSSTVQLVMDSASKNLREALQFPTSSCIDDCDDNGLSSKSFDLLKYLDAGSFGKVLLVRKKEGNNQNKMFAMKIVNKRMIIGNPQTLKSAMSESSVLESVNHPFIINLFYSFHSTAKLYYIMEYISGGNLEELICKKGALTEGLAAFYLQELVLAIEYLHTHDVIHRDVKPSNILIDVNGHIKLTDFGLCKPNISSTCRTSSMCGTVSYMAPEVLEGKEYGKEVDWWSLGVTFYEMLMYDRPFPDTRNPLELVELMRASEYEAPDHVSDEAQSVVHGFLKFKPEDRLGYSGASEIKSHEYFGDTCWKIVLECSESPPQFKRKVVRKKYNLPNPRLDSELFLVQNTDSDPFKGFSYVNPEVLRE